MHVGVDEAGKGPVLGSMFVAALRIDPDAIPDGVGDSKRLSPDRREALAPAIRDSAAAVSIIEVPTERIDDPATDMNGLTARAHAAALEDVRDPATPIYLDAADTNVVRFEQRVESHLDGPGDGADLRAEHGADESHPVVSAASILAKVERDTHVDRLAEEYGAVGSGYPSDETTREFLRTYVAEHRELPACARSSWQTSKDVLGDLHQASLGEF